MDFKGLIEKYGKNASEAKMRDLTDVIADLVTPMSNHHKEMYWCFMRDVFGVLNGGHYDMEFASHDINGMEWMDREGVKRNGGRWSITEADELRKKVQLPNDVNRFDWWVAVNASYADLCTVLDDDAIIKSACAFWFKDMDWEEGKTTSLTKIYEYMKCRNSPK